MCVIHMGILFCKHRESVKVFPVQSNKKSDVDNGQIETFVVENRTDNKMRSKKQYYNYEIRRRVNIIQSVPATPMKYVPTFCPTNLLEQKENFLRHGIVPCFNFKESPENLERIANSQYSEIKFHLLPEAKRILEMTISEFGSLDNYISESFGPRIDYLEASAYLSKYLSDHNIDGAMKILWSPDLNCSAQMMWHGPGIKYNKPEGRRYTLCVKKSSENAFLRENGIKSLADHEIGTHFFRMLNDGLQPWYSDRSRFGLATLRSREMLCTEEGLACVNTLLQAKCKLMSLSALLYYTACMASMMSFRELFEHLEIYLWDAEQRCKHVMRVKRGIKNPDATGGYGKDQCYFEGAVDILRSIDSIDFPLLMCGKIQLNEVHRVRRLVRQDCVKMPQFMSDLVKYKQQLKHIANVNGLAHYPKGRRKSMAKCAPSSVSASSSGTCGSGGIGGIGGIGGSGGGGIGGSGGTDSLPALKCTTELGNKDKKPRVLCWTKESTGRKKLLNRPDSSVNKLRELEATTNRDVIEAQCIEAEEEFLTKLCGSGYRGATQGATGSVDKPSAGSVSSPAPDAEEIVTKFGTLRIVKRNSPAAFDCR